MADVQVVRDASPPPTARGRRRLIIGVGILVALIVGASLIFVHWLHALKLPVGGGVDFAIQRPVGTTFYVPDVVVAERKQPLAVNLQSVTPVIPKNTANAQVTVLSCVQTSAIEVLGGRAMPSCKDAKPFRAGVFHLSDQPGGTGIAVRIALRHPGRLVIAGFSLTYRDGIRTGTGTSETTITAVATARTS